MTMETLKERDKRLDALAVRASLFFDGQSVQDVAVVSARLISFALIEATQDSVERRQMLADVVKLIESDLKDHEHDYRS